MGLVNWILNYLIAVDWRTAIILGPPIIVIAVVLFYQWQRSRVYNQWLMSMRRCAGIPDYRELGDGWAEVKCSNCLHTYLVWEDDENMCTNCGVHYWKTDKLPD